MRVTLKLKRLMPTMLKLLRRHLWLPKILRVRVQWGTKVVMNLKLNLNLKLKTTKKEMTRCPQKLHSQLLWPCEENITSPTVYYDDPHSLRWPEQGIGPPRHLASAWLDQEMTICYTIGYHPQALKPGPCSSWRDISWKGRALTCSRGVIRHGQKL